MSGPPAGEGSLKGRGPVTNDTQGLPLHWDDLTSLRLRGVGVRLGNWTAQRYEVTLALIYSHKICHVKFRSHKKKRH